MSITSSVQQAAAEIAQLINASPRSPRLEDIEAIIAKAVPSVLGGDDAIVRRWEAAEAAHYAVALRNEEASAGEHGSANDVLIAATRQMWREPVRGWPDIVARAKAALYWKWPRFEPDQFKAYEALVREADDLDDGPLALLVHTILTLEGEAEHVGDHPPGKRIASASEIEFAPVLDRDGKPIEFNFTNVEFANHYCPWIRLAFVMLARDKAAVLEIARELVTDPNDPEASHLLDALAMWDEIEHKFEALSAFASAAFARMTTAMEILEEQDPSISERLSPSVDRWIAEHGAVTAP